MGEITLHPEEKKWPNMVKANVISYILFWNKINRIIYFIFLVCFYFLKISIPEHLALLLCHVSFIKIPLNVFKPYILLTERLKDALVRIKFLEVKAPRRKGTSVEFPATHPLPTGLRWVSLWNLRAVGVIYTRCSGTGRALHIRWPLSL